MKKSSANKIAWIDGRGLADEPKILMKIFHCSFEHLVVNAADLPGLNAPAKVKFIVVVQSQEEINAIPENSIVLSSCAELLQEARKEGHKTGFMCRIEDDRSMNAAWQTGAHYDYLVVELMADTNIPLELLIAKLQPTHTILMKKVSTALDAEIAFGVMESGSDGVLLATSDINEIIKTDKIIMQNKNGAVKLHKGKVTHIAHAGMGYRACIDTTDLFKQNEGMIVGSTSNGGLLVSSETHFLPYMELRPFRVNAGAVHSYVWCPENQTSYMTELKGGSKVLCVDTEGNTREVVVGRIKTEVRPLLKIDVETDGFKVNAFVQDDWHIRIFGGNGEPRNASSIRVGDELLVYTCENGRHVGIKIDEHIEEQ